MFALQQYPKSTGNCGFCFIDEEILHRTFHFYAVQQFLISEPPSPSRVWCKISPHVPKKIKILEQKLSKFRESCAEMLCSKTLQNLKENTCIKDSLFSLIYKLLVCNFTKKRLQRSCLTHEFVECFKNTSGYSFLTGFFKIFKSCQWN